MTRRLYRLARSIVIVCLISLVFIPAPTSAKIYHLTILHTNDHHGHFASFDAYPFRDVGGLAAQSTLVNRVRAEVHKRGGYVLLLSAGDINMGVPESDILNAEPDFKTMSMLGYDAMVLGNHEFNKPRDVLLRQKEWAEFPFLSANVIKKDTGKTLFDPYIIREFDGLRVAIFGLTTESTPLLVFPGNVKDLAFKDPIVTAKKIVGKLRKSADVVIALTHLGFYEESGVGYKAAGDFKLAEQVPGIDVIVGGHSHTEVRDPKVIGNALIVQAGEWSKYVGRLDLVVDSDVDKVAEYSYRLIPVNMYGYTDKRYVEDKAVLAAIKPYLEKTDRLLSQIVGKALVKLDGNRDRVRFQETNLANLIADSMRAKTVADIAFQNAGGIRTGIAPGAITYRDILKVLPFQNTLVRMDMTGKQVMRVLNYAASVKPGHGAFLHVSGMRWTNNKGTAESVRIGDAPIDSAKTYRVVTNSFMASGGNGYVMFKQCPQVDTGLVDADCLRDYIAGLGRVEPRVEGRLTIIR
jgi:5'-nucleotidase/UDP-sugar diphosphatase